jgi:hypothetical protein
VVADINKIVPDKPRGVFSDNDRRKRQGILPPGRADHASWQVEQA